LYALTYAPYHGGLGGIRRELAFADYLTVLLSSHGIYLGVRHQAQLATTRNGNSGAASSYKQATSNDDFSKHGKGVSLEEIGLNYQYICIYGAKMPRSPTLALANYTTPQGVNV
jgi:hypothetical protein